MDECRLCGCTDIAPCADPFDGGLACYWIAPGICSACRFAPLAIRAPLPSEREPIASGLVLTPAGGLRWAGEYFGE